MRISDWSSDVCSSDLLISGRGSNMQTIVNTVQERSLPAAVSAVIANKADAAGLEWAQARGIRTAVVPHRDYDSREARSEERRVGQEWVSTCRYRWSTHL